MNMPRRTRRVEQHGSRQAGTHKQRERQPTYFLSSMFQGIISLWWNVAVSIGQSMGWLVSIFTGCLSSGVGEVCRGGYFLLPYNE
jgi:hypothetical protein